VYIHTNCFEYVHILCTTAHTTKRNIEMKVLLKLCVDAQSSQIYQNIQYAILYIMYLNIHNMNYDS
jgi:hypothetical protein